MLGKFRLIDLSVPRGHGRQRADARRDSLRRHEGEGLEQMQQFFGVRPEDLLWSERPGLGRRRGPGDHPHRHPRRCTRTTTAPTSEGRPARHDRRGAAGMVLCSRRGARRAAQGGGGVHHRRRPASVPGPDRLSPQAARHRAAAHRGRQAAATPPTISPSRAWAAKACCGWSSRG